MASFIWRINSPYTVTTSFDIRQAIDASHIDSPMSPIDQFVSTNQELMALLIDPNNFEGRINDLRTSGQIKITNKSLVQINNSLFNSSLISPVLANLVLLGHISAVESYFRTVFRKLILIDTITQEACYEKMLSYSAVLFHDEKSLPDALLEFISFSGKHNIEESLKQYFGVKGHLSPTIARHLEEFAKVCQMRHCIVHKFGRLGSNNLKHDLVGHKSYINKPIKNDFNSIQEISQICTNLVHEINQYLWQNVMMRQIADYNSNRWYKKSNIIWTLNWKNDRIRFKKYFDIFFSNYSLPINSEMKAAYLDYKNIYLTM